MRRLSRDRFVNDLNKAHPPAYQIEDGETIVVETSDCHGGFVSREGVLQAGAPPPNPATGPVAVEGSQPGEALALSIHDVKPADWGFIGGGEDVPFTVVEIRDGIATYPWGLRLAVIPIIGVIGVAPPGDPVPTNIPSDWGGCLCLLRCFLRRSAVFRDQTFPAPHPQYCLVIFMGNADESAGFVVILGPVTPRCLAHVHGHHLGPPVVRHRIRIKRNDIIDTVIGCVIPPFDTLILAGLGTRDGH